MHKDLVLESSRRVGGEIESPSGLGLAAKLL